GGRSRGRARPARRARANGGMELPSRTLLEPPGVAGRARGRREPPEGRPPLMRAQRPAQLPLSYAQQRLWFIDRLQGSSTEYNMAQALRLQGELDVDALGRAIQSIVERHESLRTRFIEIDGRPLQVIEPKLEIGLPVEDLSRLDEAGQQERVTAEIWREEQEPFDLGRGPVLRVKLLKLGQRDHILLQNFHHIVSDGWSQGVFNQELKLLYEAYSEGADNPLEPLGVQYADFTLWQRQWLDEAALGREMDYWKRQLAGIPERLELPADRPRSPIQTFDAQICSRRFDPDRLAELKRLGQEHQASLFMTPLGGFAVLMNRYIGQDDIVVGSPIANRQERQLEELIGFFMNSLVLRVRVKGESSFSELVSEVRQTTLDAYQHQEIPFERLVEELGVERSLNTTPVFQVMFAMQNAPIKAQQLEGLTIEPLGSEKLQVRYDLEVHAFEENGELWVHWLYNRDLFDPWRIEQMADHYERLMTAAVAAPQEPLSGLEMLSAEESRRLLVELNQTGQPIPDQMLAELFQRQAEQTPKAVANPFGQGKMDRRG